MRTPTLSKLSRLMTLVVGVMFCVQNHADGQQNWQRFRVVKEGFSVLLPELPAVVSRGQYGTTPVRDARVDARIYAAYQDGVAYLVIFFDNPKDEHPLEYFFDEQLSKNELRNTEIVTKNGTIEARFPGVQYAFTKYDFRKTSSYPGILRLYAGKNRTLALLAIGKGESDASVSEFLRSLELSDKPAGTDIGNGGSNTSDAKQGADSAVVAANDVSRKAMILIKPEPHYTDEARRKHLVGKVVLSAVLSASGKLTNIQVVSGVPGLAESGIQAAGKMYFIPAVKDGHFVSTTVELQYNFNLF